MDIPTTEDANRPRETAADRLRWAYGVEPDPAAEDTMVDACDYRGQRRSSVIADCLIEHDETLVR